MNEETKKITCRIASARGKVSKLDSGDNKLSASLLASRLGETVVKSIPEKTNDLST